jgi:cytochrome P450
MTESVVTPHQADAVPKCPVADIEWEGAMRDALAGHAMADQLRAMGPVVKVPSGSGFYMLTGHEETLRVAQDAETFPQWTTIIATGEPMPVIPIPENLNGPIHTKWRRVLAPYFSPREAARWQDRIRALAVELIDAIVDKGKCDFTADFALRYPTTIFLELMGLPTEQLEDLLRWEQAILHWDSEQGPEAMVAAQLAVMEYFANIIAERRAAPRGERPPGLITESLDWEIDGELISDEDLLRFHLLMFMAGLDTVTAELGYGFLHLATHPDDRRKIVERPELIPNAMEEMLRLYPIVNAPREAARDTEIAGCPIRKGEFVVLGMPGAGRDSAFYEDARVADFEGPARPHLTFGAGPHRCLGAHLARHELAIAYEEWHKRIPDYSVDEDIPMTETAGQMFSLNNLPLRWDTAQG